MPFSAYRPHLEDLPSVDIRRLKAKGMFSVGQIEALEVDSKRIKLSTTKPKYGGIRYWFVCPQCLTRRVCLYRLRGHWKCRECTGLQYRSQAYDKQSQALLQKARLEAKLESDGSKPKWMRWPTYYRLLEEIEYYQDLADQRFLESRKMPTMEKVKRIIKRTGY